MAECYLKSRKPEWSVFSAGTEAVEGCRAAEHALSVVKEHGLDLSGHRSRSIERYSGTRFDLVLAMSESHLANLENWKTARLLSSLRDLDRRVSDPFGCDVEQYRSTFKEIRYYLDVL
jgi:protein-tyrosine-phosphatase